MAVTDDGKDRKECPICRSNKLRSSLHFYKAYNEKINPDGLVNYCKKCLHDMIEYNDDKEPTELSLRKMLVLINRPFIYSCFNSAKKSQNDFLGSYIKNINMVQFRLLGYKNSNAPINDNNIFNDNDVCGIEKQVIDDFKITTDMISRWGSKYNKKQIMDLEKFYQDMLITHTIVTPQHKKSLVFICKIQLKLDYYLETDDMGNFTKLQTQYQSLLTSSGLRRIDTIGGDEATGMRSFSHIYEEVEKDGYLEPREYTEKQDIVDKTIMYLLNYTLKSVGKSKLIEPPKDTPKVGVI